MSISPFSARPAPSRGDQSEIGKRRARLAVLIAIVGIGATLLAYLISPGVRHAVSHAAHSVKHAVGRVLDHDTSKPTPVKRTAHPARPSHRAHATRPAPSRSASAANGSRISGGFTITSSSTTTSR